VGDLRTQFARAFNENPPAAGGRSWIFTPAIGITETYDSAAVTGRGYGPDFITNIAPSLTVTGASRRLAGSFSYSPNLRFQALHGGQNGISHNLNATATATLVKDLLFVDLRGYATVQPVLGGFAATGGGGRQNEVQTTNFSVSPYLQHRFGDTGTLVVGYTAAMSSISTVAGKSASAAANAVSGDYNTQQEHATFTTGPSFGRILASLSAMAMQYDGNGVYRGAHNETFNTSVGYAVTRTIVVTASIGHNSLVYGPGGPRPIDEITWSGGLRLTPNADSLINISYGHQQGGTSLSLDGSYAMTPRLRLSARYSQAVGTGMQFLQSALAGATVGPAGIMIDRTNGLPVQIGNDFLGIQNGVYRTTNASFSAVLLQDRDTYSLTLDSTDRQLLSSAATGAFRSTSGQTATLSWQHLLSEALTMTTTGQYGMRSISGQGDQTTIAFSLNGSYRISETLSTTLLISHSETAGATYGLPPTRDIVVIGLHKAF
jgi:uncharacterized protein (PEP-CTERM system associated)